MRTINIGINGFGRIGRTLFRLLHGHPNIKVTAINDLADSRTMAHLLKYDSIHGRFLQEVSFEENALVVNGTIIGMQQQEHPKGYRLEGW